MESTNLNICQNRTKPHSSNVCINEKRCYLNASTISFKKLPDDCIQVQNERNLPHIKLEHLNNEENLTDIGFGKVNDKHKICTCKANKLCISSSRKPAAIKLESVHRAEEHNLRGFVHSNITEKIDHLVYKNNEKNASKKPDGCITNNKNGYGDTEQFDEQINIKERNSNVHVTMDPFCHCDNPAIEEKTENYELGSENPTNIVCSPDIMGELIKSHTKNRRKKVKRNSGRKPEIIGQMTDAKELDRVAFIAVDSEVCRSETPQKQEDLGRLGILFPTSSQPCRKDPVEEFILPDILPVKLQTIFVSGTIAPSVPQGIEWISKNKYKEFPKSTHFKKDGPLTDFRPKMKKFIMDDFNMITGQNKTSDFTIKCSECKLTFRKRFHLKEHNKLNHSKRKFTFSCSWEECNFTCYLEKGLKTHMISHTGEKPYICSLCDVGFSTRGKLNKHILTHSDTKPFTCQECNYTCSSKGDLKRHSVIHTGAKKFACTICDYSGYRKDNLKAHMLTHSGEKPFPCTLCSVKCSRNGDLVRHMLTHSGEKPFGCSQCKYKCLKKSDLSRHALTHTGEKRHPCPVCTHVSATKSNLKLHMAVHKSRVSLNKVKK